MTTEPFTLSSEPQPAKRQWLIPEPVELLVEHPFADRKWVLAKELPEPQRFLLCTVEGQTLALQRESVSNRPMKNQPGGRLWASNTGQGSVFRFALPVRDGRK